MIRSLIQQDHSPIGAESEAMRATRPGQVVGNVELRVAVTGIETALVSCRVKRKERSKGGGRCERGGREHVKRRRSCSSQRIQTRHAARFLPGVVCAKSIGK